MNIFQRIFGKRESKPKKKKQNVNLGGLPETYDFHSYIDVPSSTQHESFNLGSGMFGGGGAGSSYDTGGVDTGGDCDGDCDGGD